MPSTRDIRRRIKSVKNTAQITKAMQMVAASKMRKAQQIALAGRPYAVLMNEVLAEVTANAGDFSHPLTEARAVRSPSPGGADRAEGGTVQKHFTEARAVRSPSPGGEGRG